MNQSGAINQIKNLFENYLTPEMEKLIVESAINSLVLEASSKVFRQQKENRIKRIANKGILNQDYKDSLVQHLTVQLDSIERRVNLFNERFEK